MPKLRRLSGGDVVKILASTIPLHAELDSGTLRAIVRQAGRYISEHELHQHFFCS